MNDNDFKDTVVDLLREINTSLKDLTSAIRESRTPPRFFDPSTPPTHPPAPRWPYPLGPGDTTYPSLTCEDTKTAPTS